MSMCVCECVSLLVYLPVYACAYALRMYVCAWVHASASTDVSLCARVCVVSLPYSRHEHWFYARHILTRSLWRWLHIFAPLDAQVNLGEIFDLVNFIPIEPESFPGGIPQKRTHNVLRKRSVTSFVLEIPKDCLLAKNGGDGILGT